METITLDYPLHINGGLVKEISYDPADFRTRDFLTACNLRGNTNPGQMSNLLNDYDLHFNIAVAAILASNQNKGWVKEDFDRLAGSDPFKFAIVGMSFFGVKPEEQNRQNSGGLSDSTPEDTEPVMTVY